MNATRCCTLAAIAFAATLAHASDRARRAPPASGCAALAGIALAHTSITLARRYDRGGVVDDDGRPGGITANPVRAPASLCRVAGIIRRRPGSVIRFEIWLPDRWNGRYMQSGNGGFAGSIPRTAIAALVSTGAAAAATDDGTGTAGDDPAHALRRNPAAVEDWAYLAAHLTAVTAKAVVRAFYGRRSVYDYFIGCSKGGNEGLSEAQRYPAEFDGIIAGAPGISQTETLGYLIAVQQQLSDVTHPERMLLNRKLPALQAEVGRQCAAAYLPGDAFMNDPLSCRFDPAPLLCRTAETDRCLTAAQIAGLRTVLAGRPRRPQDVLAYGAIPEFATGWRNLVTLEGVQSAPSVVGRLGSDYYANLLDRPITPATFDPRRDPQEMLARFEAATAADDADLSAFAAGGGRLIVWHGWGDTVVMAKSSISYVHRVERAIGARAARAALRLYLVPGMAHCAGGPGPVEFGQGLGYAGSALPGDRPAGGSIVAALVAWVERQRPPGAIIGTGRRDGVSYDRPICPYPLLARRAAGGDPAVATGYGCGR